jgi:3-methyladenine DNA glycosylase AlkD
VPAHHDLLDDLRRALGTAGDAVRAAGQQRYMKSAMPYWGLTSPVLRATVRPILDEPAYRIETRQEWEGTIRALWDEATHREEWYAALAVARHRHYRRWRDSDTMPLYRHLIETGAWWDVVDDIATHLVREVVLGNPEVEGLRMREWADDEHLWIRRSAVICQVGAKDRTDPVLLADVIEPNLSDRDFFVRKAIGWALRDYARTRPEWVKTFVSSHESLSGLSRREALKHLG